MYKATLVLLLSLSVAACGAELAAPEHEVDEVGEVTAAIDLLPAAQPQITGMSPAWGPAGTPVTLTGSNLGVLSCTGGARISFFLLLFGQTAVTCSYDAATGAIHTTIPAATTSSASFAIQESFTKRPPCFFGCQGVRIVTTSALFTYTVPLHVVNHTHYTLLTAAFNTLRFGGTLAPGQSQDFNDASFTPGSHLNEGFDLGHAFDRAVALSLGGSGTLGTGPLTVDLIFTAAQGLSWRGSVNASGKLCAQYSNFDPFDVQTVNVCSTATGAGTATVSWQTGSFTVTDGAGWTTDSDIFPFVLGGLIGSFDFNTETFSLSDNARPPNVLFFHR